MVSVETGVGGSKKGSRDANLERHFSPSRSTLTTVDVRIKCNRDVGEGGGLHLVLSAKNVIPITDPSLSPQVTS